MRKEEQLLEKVGRHTGMKAPDGYFEAFAQQIMDNLPAYPEAPRPKQLTTWQRIKPYVYLAAMFAGIWCMMKMFHMASQKAGTVGLDNPPESIVLALEEGDSFEYFYIPSDYAQSDFEVETDLSESYDNINDFAEDFGYDLKPEYASMNITTDSRS